MTCSDHVCPLPDCIGCLGRWDRDAVHRVLDEYLPYGIAKATIRGALAEIDRLVAVIDVGDQLAGRLLAERDALTVARNADRTEWMATYETMRGRIAELEAESLKWYQSAADGIDGALEHGVCEVAVAEEYGRNEVERANATADFVVGERDARIAELEQLVANLRRVLGTDRDCMTLRTRVRSAHAERDESRAEIVQLHLAIEALRCGDLNEFFDEQLSPERAEAFRGHLAVCTDCAAALRDLEQIEKRVIDAKPEPTRSER